MRRGDYQWSLKTADTKAGGWKGPGFICTVNSGISEAKRITKEIASTGPPGSFGHGADPDWLVSLVRPIPFFVYFVCFVDRFVIELKATLRIQGWGKLK